MTFSFTNLCQCIDKMQIWRVCGGAYDSVLQNSQKFGPRHVYFQSATFSNFRFWRLPFLNYRKLRKEKDGNRLHGYIEWEQRDRSTISLGKCQARGRNCRLKKQQQRSNQDCPLLHTTSKQDGLPELLSSE